MKSRILWGLGSVAFACALLGLWQVLADSGLIPAAFFPGPDRVWRAIDKGLGRGALLGQTLGTVERMFYGWVLASVAGIAAGALIGTSAMARRIFGPTLELMRPVPASAIIPLAVALLGLTNTMVVAIVAFGAFWPMLLATVQGFVSVEPRLYEVSRALGMSRLAVIRKIALPSAMPDILSGLRLSITVALGLSVVGEILAGRDGLGQWIMLASRSFRAADVFAGVVLLGVIGVTTAFALAKLESRLLVWRPSR